MSINLEHLCCVCFLLPLLLLLLQTDCWVSACVLADRCPSTMAMAMAMGKSPFLLLRGLVLVLVFFSCFGLIVVWSGVVGVVYLSVILPGTNICVPVIAVCLSVCSASLACFSLRVSHGY